jgi:hypothetical protein
MKLTYCPLEEVGRQQQNIIKESTTLLGLVLVSQQVYPSIVENASIISTKPLSLEITLEYLTRFCSNHRLYS